jgi:hypothetical protein
MPFLAYSGTTLVNPFPGTDLRALRPHRWERVYFEGGSRFARKTASAYNANTVGRLAQLARARR